jgi:hypothetical protein
MAAKVLLTCLSKDLDMPVAPRPICLESQSTKMKQGFNVVIGGSHFRPLEIDFGNANIPDVIMQSEARGNEAEKPSHIEWNFWGPIEKGTDYLSEAIGFLDVHQEQIREIGRAAGVEHRSVNIVISCEEAAFLVLEAREIHLLNDLHVDLTIAVQATTFDAPE